MKINVVIPTYNRLKLLDQTVDSILRNYIGRDVLIYIINNYSEHNIVYDNNQIVVLRGEVNGPCHARNLALKSMRFCDWVWFADDDIYVYDDMVYRILEECKYNVITFKTVRKFGFLNVRLFNNDLRKSDMPNDEVQMVSGGNFAIKFSLAQSIIWDVKYMGYSYGEDVIYGHEVVSRGEKILYLPSVQVYHFGLNRKWNNSAALRQIYGTLYVNKVLGKKQLSYIRIFLKLLRYGQFVNIILFLFIFMKMSRRDSISCINEYNKIR